MSKTLFAILFGICLAITVFSVVRYNSKDTELSAFIVKYNKFQADAAKVTIWADSIVVANAAKDAVIAKQDTVIAGFKKKDVVIAATTDTLKSKVDSLKAAAKTITDKDLLLANKDSTIGTLTKIVVNDSIRLYGKDTTITLRERQLAMSKAEALSYKFRGDSLQNVLNANPIKPKNPDRLFNGLIPMPSRTVTFLLGVATGFYIIKKL